MINNRNLRYIIGVFGEDYSIENENKGEVSYHCPFCPSLGHRNDDKKLYVNVNKLVYQCFRCESKGSLNHEVSSDFNDVDIGKVFSDYLSDNVQEEETSYFNIPKTLLINEKDSTGYHYMRDRGFTDEDIELYSMRLSGVGNLMGRVIIPNEIISKNWTDMYVARSYLDHPNRYKNPSNSRKSKILFNYHRIPDNPEYMILNEGPLNSIIAGKLSVASFGKVLSQDQLEMILSKNPTHLYVSYDTDARKYALQVCDSIKARSDIHVHLVELPEVWDENKQEMKGLDAVDLGRDKYYDIVFNTPEFVNSKIYNIFSSLLGS